MTVYGVAISVRGTTYHYHTTRMRSVLDLFLDTSGIEKFKITIEPNDGTPNRTLTHQESVAMLFNLDPSEVLPAKVSA